MLIVNGANLRAAIIDAGLSIREVSRLTGLMPRVISEMCHKPNRFVRLKSLSKLRNALGNISLGELILADKRRSEVQNGN